MKSSVVLNNAEVRIILLFYPSTLISAMNDNKELVIMILLDNCERELFANAALAFVADCEDVDGVHGFRKQEELFNEIWVSLGRRICLR